MRVGLIRDSNTPARIQMWPRRRNRPGGAVNNTYILQPTKDYIKHQLDENSLINLKLMYLRLCRRVSVQRLASAATQLIQRLQEAKC